MDSVFPIILMFGFIVSGGLLFLLPAFDIFKRSKVVKQNEEKDPLDTLIECQLDILGNEMEQVAEIGQYGRLQR
jgi:hypothetical protein